MAEEGWWLLVGFGGQALFMGRFVLQWLVSERRRRSVIPVSFWYLSICGALVLLAYALHRRDPVFVVGQGLGVAIYLRNLQLIRAERMRTTADEQAGEQAEEPAEHQDGGQAGKEAGNQAGNQAQNGGRWSS